MPTRGTPRNQTAPPPVWMSISAWPHEAQHPPPPSRPSVLVVPEQHFCAAMLRSTSVHLGEAIWDWMALEETTLRRKTRKSPRCSSAVCCLRISAGGRDEERPSVTNHKKLTTHWRREKGRPTFSNVLPMYYQCTINVLSRYYRCTVKVLSMYYRGTIKVLSMHYPCTINYYLCIIHVPSL